MAKFFISDTKKLDGKYGKWYYYQKGCRVLKKDGRLIIYYGYTIHKPINEYIETDPYSLKYSNGKYCVVILEKNHMEVIVDYFCQTKIFYRNTDRIEVTNQIYMMPLTSSDINIQELNERKKAKHLFKSEVDADKNSPIEQLFGHHQYKNDVTKTIWNDVYVLEPDHCIVADKKITVERLHNTLERNKQAFNFNNPGQMVIDPHNQVRWPFRSARDAEEYIHVCMEDHANIIKKTYKNVANSISEGIDSVLIDQYFPDAKRIMYNMNPPSGPFEYKQKIINDYKSRNIPIELYTMEQDQAGKVAAETLNDPDVFFLDMLPSYAQAKQLKDVDVLLFGQNGDQMFMHRPTFLYAYLFSKQYANDNNKEEVIEKYKDCYSATKDIWAYKGYSLENEIEKRAGRDWKEFFAYDALPGLYNREMEHCIEVPTTSLYCDKRIFNVVHQLDEKHMFESVKDASIQKNILKRKFNYSIPTPNKDGSPFDLWPIVTPMLKATIANCLEDHLA